MKNLKFAVLAAMGLTLSVSAEVLSANIVGYQTQPIVPSGYTMFTVPFVHLNGDTDGLKLNEDLTFANVTGSEFPFAADQIMIWDPTKFGYVVFSYFGGSSDFDAGWYYVTGDQGRFEEYYPHGLAEGAALYYRAKAGENKSATGAGEVEGSGEVEIEAEKYTMLGNPFPVATQLNTNSSLGIVANVVFEDATMSDNPNEADQIWIWDASKAAYDKFYCTSTGWRLATNGWLIEYVDGYAGGIPSGSAFFYKAKGSKVTAVFDNPIK